MQSGAGAFLDWRNMYVSDFSFDIIYLVNTINIVETAFSASHYACFCDLVLLSFSVFPARQYAILSVKTFGFCLLIRLMFVRAFRRNALFVFIAWFVS